MALRTFFDGSLERRSTSLFGSVDLQKDTPSLPSSSVDEGRLSSTMGAIQEEDVAKAQFFIISITPQIIFVVIAPTASLFRHSPLSRSD